MLSTSCADRGSLPLTHVSAEPTLSLDFSAKRARRTPSKASEKELVVLQLSENEENEPAESDYPTTVESTPAKSLSRRTSIASTVKSCMNTQVHPAAVP